MINLSWNGPWSVSCPIAFPQQGSGILFERGAFTRSGITSRRGYGPSRSHSVMTSETLNVQRSDLKGGLLSLHVINVARREWTIKSAFNYCIPQIRCHPSRCQTRTGPPEAPLYVGVG